ncbi:glutamate--cysteine ligase [Entomophthora muscae]|uniref:Glutamate--cysteine ligase n=1 Tax=Entomophthora muscae TaxID=34485 RepID=A0ACC2SP00_9FUNG|nr:glutamate--cysteine ligase [Entomophthora muscae]
MYIPISKVDYNMNVAHKRGAVLHEKFYFRKNIFPKDQDPSLTVDEESVLLSIDEIINGKPGVFIGLIPVINSYLCLINVDVETSCTLRRYLDLIGKRANGSLLTTASWIRKFVDAHPDYHHDSVISEKVNYDLVSLVHRIDQGKYDLAPELLNYSSMN